MTTYANQKVIHIEKAECTKDFLQVSNNDWMEAARTLNGNAFKIYLYLASNKDGYNLALSPKAIENALDVPKKSYSRAIEELEENGYITYKKGNVYVFTTHPNEVGDKMTTGCSQNDYSVGTKCPQDGVKMSTEIDKHININNIYNISKEEQEDIDFGLTTYDEVIQRRKERGLNNSPMAHVSRPHPQPIEASDEEEYLNTEYFDFEESEW